ncbi:helix-turn-helix domain-containing protein [Rhodovulum sp. DZ06]|uniref:helix-turn-helix domain-containing protein n=1 Tax=Rhodovulum sp. DZ06 TaxID=3425126 RepID=UPI003D332329
MAVLQTLDRGLAALAMLGDAPDGLSVAELAAGLGVDRAIAYRIVATLEGRGMARRAGARVLLGAGALALGARVAPHLRLLARGPLAALARAAGGTAFLSAAEGADCVALAVEEPEAGLIRVGYKVGSRHPLGQGAAGIAILAGRAAAAGEAAEVAEARARGWCVTRGALQAGAVGVAAPLRAGAAGIDASVGVVAMEDLDVDRAAALVRACAAELSGALGA